MLAKLVQLGATHAARMHAAHAQEAPQAWTEQDWLEHFAEEERLIFPRLLALGYRLYVNQLAREHALFRQQLRAGRSVDLDLMKRHADLEDQLVLAIP